jgi:hypothetical protein
MKYHPFCIVLLLSQNFTVLFLNICRQKTTTTKKNTQLISFTTLLTRFTTLLTLLIVLENGRMAHSYSYPLNTVRLNDERGFKKFEKKLLMQ